MTAIDRMPDWLWESYGEECNCGVAGYACAQLDHLGREEDEIDTLTAQHRMVTS